MLKKMGAHNNERSGPVPSFSDTGAGGGVDRNWTGSPRDAPSTPTPHSRRNHSTRTHAPSAIEFPKRAQRDNSGPPETRHGPRAKLVLKRRSSAPILVRTIVRQTAVSAR